MTSISETQSHPADDDVPAQPPATEDLDEAQHNESSEIEEEADWYKVRHSPITSNMLQQRTLPFAKPHSSVPLRHASLAGTVSP